MTRPSLDEYMMGIARLAATRTTCIRRGVGCVLADSRGRVLSVGYNGVAVGTPHCNEPTDFRIGNTGSPDWEDVRIPIYGHACEGHDLPPGQDSCEAVHAEQNALVQCARPDDIHTAYVTLSPCKACAKLLMNTGCKRIIFLEEHDYHIGNMWRKSRPDRTWDQLVLT